MLQALSIVENRADGICLTLQIVTEDDGSEFRQSRDEAEAESMLGGVIYAKSFDSYNSDPRQGRRLHCVEHWCTSRHDDSQILALCTLSISRDGLEDMLPFDILISCFPSGINRGFTVCTIIPKPFLLPNLNNHVFRTQ